MSDRRGEIMDAIRFYEANGLDWTDIVAFLAMRASWGDDWLSSRVASSRRSNRHGR